VVTYDNIVDCCVKLTILRN